MATRWFVIPMQKPATADGRGTGADPWRPKYLREAGLWWRGGCNYRYWMLTQVEGADAALDVLAGNPDVLELPATGVLPQNLQNRLRQFLDKRGTMPVDTSLPVEQLIPAVIAAMVEVQKRETEADRLAILAELTA